MALPQVLLQIVAQVQGSAQVQALRSGLQQLAAQARQGIGNPFASVANGASGATSSILGVHAGLLTVIGAAAGVGAALKAGLNINAEVESSTLGIKALVASMYDVRDASGKLAQGPEQLAIAGQLANDQIQKLRIAGLETSATFQQLVEAFQQGIGAGAAAGLGLDQVRELTVGIVQAAGALNVPMHQLNQEVRSLLSGQISADSSVAKALQISNAQMKEWTKAGTVFDELQTRFEVYRRTGAEAAQTWTATFSNMREAMSMFLGTASRGAFDNIKKSLQTAFAGVFDVKTGGISEQFKGLQDLFTQMFDGIGNELAGAIRAGVEVAKELSEWLDKNRDMVSRIGDNAGMVWDQFKGVAGLVAGVFGDMVKTNTENGVWADGLMFVARQLAKIRDGFTIIGMLMDRASAWNLRDANPQMADMYTKRAENTERRLMTNGALATLEANAAENERKRAEARAAADRAAADAAARGGKGPGKTSTGNATNKTRELTDEEKKEREAAAKKAERARKEFEKAEETLAKAKVEAKRKTAASAREADMAQADADLTAGKISHDEYMAKKRSYLKEEYDLELEELQLQKATIAKRKTNNATEALLKQAALKKVDADITALVNKDRTATIKLVADDAQFKRQVADLETDLAAKLMSAQGDDLGAEKLRRKAEYEKLKLSAEFAKSNKVQRDAAKLDSLADDKDTYDRAKQAFDLHLQELSDLDRDYREQVEMGSMTTLQAETAMKDARAKHVDAMEAELAAMIRVAEASKNPDMVAAAKAAKAELTSMKRTADSVARDINKSMSDGAVDGLTNFLSQLDDIADGSVKMKDVVKDSLRGMVLSFLDAYKQIVAKNLAEAMFGKLGGSTSSMGGYFNAGAGGFDFAKAAGAIGGFLGFSEGGVVPSGRGGIIRGPGTGTSDSILARVSKDEGILTADFTRKFGANTVYMLNRIAKGFSSGGVIGGKSTDEVGGFGSLIGAMVPGLGQKASSSSGQANVRIVNVLEPGLVADHMDSAEGEQTIENVMRRNPTKYRAALGL